MRHSLGGAGWVPRPGLYIRSFGVRFPGAPALTFFIITQEGEKSNEYLAVLLKFRHKDGGRVPGGGEILEVLKNRGVVLMEKGIPVRFSQRI